MKTAIYLEDGITQVALTAETEWEKAVLAQIDGQQLSVHRGGFYHCQGGWFRWKPVFQEGPYGDRNPPDSLLLRVNKTTTEGP